MGEQANGRFKFLPRRAVDSTVRQLGRYIREKGMERMQPTWCNDPMCGNLCERRMGVAYYDDDSFNELTLMAIAQANGVTLKLSRTDAPSDYCKQCVVCILPPHDDVVIFDWW